MISRRWGQGRSRAAAKRRSRRVRIKKNFGACVVDVRTGRVFAKTDAGFLIPADCFRSHRWRWPDFDKPDHLELAS